MFICVPFEVTKMLPVMCPTESHPKDQGIVLDDGLLSKFKEPLLIGARGGTVAVLDLHFDHSSLEDENLAEHPSQELRHSLANYERESWLAEQSDDLTHPWLDLSASFDGQTGRAQNIFFYLNPKPGEFVGHIQDAEPVPRDAVTITSLQLMWPAPASSVAANTSTMSIDANEEEIEEDAEDQTRLPSNWIPGLSTPLFVVGFNFGTFQIWALDTMELLYCSPITESRAPVTSFEVQSLHNIVGTPSENKVLLWVGRGSISTTHTQQAHPPSVSAYSISLIKQSSSGELLGSSHPPLALSDCIASIISECSSSLPSTFEDDYYGQVRLIQVLPCWESNALNNSSIAIVYETFPLHPPTTPGSYSSSTPKSPKSLECLILSTSSLQIESEKLFVHPDQLLQLSMPYQLTPIANDPSMLLSFEINPSSIQHYFPRITGNSKMSSGSVTRAHVSFEAMAITEESIWKIGYSSFGQQLLNALVEQGPIVFDRPDIIAPLLHHLDRSMPSSEEDTHSLRDELFSLALHNNLASVISDYVLDSVTGGGGGGVGAGGGTLASLSLSNAPTTSLHHVLSWARTNFHRILNTAHLLVDDYLAEPETAFATTSEKNNFVLELRQAKRLLNDLYNIVKALVVKYKTQRQKWGAQEEAMQKDLERISVGTQFIDCCLWFVQNPFHLPLDSIRQKTQVRRTRSAECAKNSPTMWEVAFDSKSPFVLNSSGTEATRLTVTPKPFTASSDGGLLIDHLIAQIPASSEASQSISYPPTSLAFLVHWTKTGDPVFIAQKHQVIYYLLLEISEELAMQFANRMLLTPGELKLVKGLHMIDSNNYDEAMQHITHTQVVSIISDDLALKIMRTLNDARAFPHALSFYRLRQPPLDSLSSIILALYVYLSNGLISEAFFMVRGQSRTTLDSFDPLYLHTLFFHFLHHLYNNHILKDVFQLPFDPIESEAVKQYLLWSQDTSKAVDMHLVFLLQRSRISDAVSWYHEQNQAHPSGDRDNEAMKAHLINNYIRMLPPVIRSTLKSAPMVAKGTSSSSFSSSSQISKRATKQTVQASQHASSTSSSTAAATPAGNMTPSKKIVSKLFSNAQQQSQPKSGVKSSSRFAPASLGPALLSPTNPGRFARSPAIFRPTVVLSTAATETRTQEGDTDATPGSKLETSLSSVPRQSLFYDRDIGTNLIATPAKKLFGTNSKSMVATGASTTPSRSLSSTTAPTPHVSATTTIATNNTSSINSQAQQAPVFATTIVSQDSLIDIDEDDDLVVEMPTAPISTPTKKVMDSVLMQSNEVRRQSHAIADVRHADGDADEDDIVLVETDDDQEHGGEEGEEEMEEEDEEEEEEEEEERDRHRHLQEDSDIDDESLERIRGQSDAEEDHDMVVEEHSETMDESASRASRRSAASARSRLSEYARSSRSGASRASSSIHGATTVSSRASSSRTPGRKPSTLGATGRRAFSALQTVVEESHVSSSQETTPRLAARDPSSVAEEPNTGSHRSRRSTHSNISRSSAAPSTSKMDETIPAGRRSSRLTTTSRTSTSPTLGESYEPAVPPTTTTATSSKTTMPEQDPSAESHPKRRSSRLRPPSTSASMAVDDPTAPAAAEALSEAATAPSSASSSRRSSRLQLRQTTVPISSDIVVEPLGVHPETAEAQPTRGDSDSDDMSSDTIRIRRSSRNTKPQAGGVGAPSTPAGGKTTTTATPRSSQTSVSSRSRSLRLKEKHK